MSFLEDYVRENQALGREEITRRMLGAGYGKSEIDAAWRHRGRGHMSASASSPGGATRLPGLPAGLTVRRIMAAGAGMALAVLITAVMLGWIRIDGWIVWLLVALLTLWTPLSRLWRSGPPPMPPATRVRSTRSDAGEQ